MPYKTQISNAYLNGFIVLIYMYQVAISKSQLNGYLDKFAL